MKTPLLERALAAGAGATGGVGVRRVTPGAHVQAHLRLLRPRLDLLAAEDRMLCELVSSGERSLHAFARLSGEHAGTLSRRFRTLWRRLHDPILDVVLAKQCPLPPEHRQIAVENVLLGMSVCALADKHRMPKSQVQVILAYIRTYVASRGMTPGAAIGPSMETSVIDADVIRAAVAGSAGGRARGE